MTDEQGRLRNGDILYPQSVIDELCVRIAQQDTTIAAQINRERDFVARIAQLEQDNRALRDAGIQAQRTTLALEAENAALRERMTTAVAHLDCEDPMQAAKVLIGALGANRGGK